MTAQNQLLVFSSVKEFDQEPKELFRGSIEEFELEVARSLARADFKKAKNMSSKKRVAFLSKREAISYAAMEDIASRLNSLREDASRDRNRISRGTMWGILAPSDQPMFGGVPFKDLRLEYSSKGS